MPTLGLELAVAWRVKSRSEKAATVPRRPSKYRPRFPFSTHSDSSRPRRCCWLEICVTYLYCLAKELQDGRASSHAMLATQCFLRYVAQTWMVHFGQLQHKLQLRDRDLWYFHNLCHPLFPAIQTWTREYCQPDVSKQPIGVPDDHIQEYYPGRFNLQCQVVRY